MAKKKINNSKKIIYIVVCLIIIVLSIILFLLVGNNKKDSNFVGTYVYKYKVGLDNHKYYLEKIASSKIGIEETYKVSCANNNCYFLNSYFVEGNIYDSLTILYDDNYYLVDFIKGSKDVIDVKGIRLANFTKDGSYILLFTSNNSFYAYNINKKTVSKEIPFDYIVYDKSFEIFDNSIFIYKDNEFKLVNLDSGSTSEDSYDNVRKINNYYILTKDGIDSVYSSTMKEMNISFEKVLDVNDKYALVVNFGSLYLVDVNTQKKISVITNNYSYDYVSMNYDSEFVNIVLRNNKCYKNTYSLTNDDINVSTIECPSSNMTKDFYVLSNKGESIVIKYGKDFKNSYDLTVTKNDFLYDIYGNFYDKIVLNSQMANNSFTTGFDVIKGDEYNFLKDKFDNFGLSMKIQNDYYNKLIPIMIRNKENFVHFEIEFEKENNSYKILSDIDSFIGINIYLDNKYKNLPDDSLEKFDTAGFSVVVMSIY